MDGLLNRLERRFGRYALGNVTYLLIGLQAVGFVLAMVRPDVIARMALDADRVLAGEWWRLFTWLMYPVSTSPIFVLFALYFLYSMGSAIESEWGAFKYELFWVVGIAATLLVAFVLRVPATVAPLVMALFLAFATLWPDYQIRLYMILPVRVKWLALLDGCFILVQIGMSSGWQRLVPVVAVGNYLLFFGPTLVSKVRGYLREGGQAARMSRFRDASRVGREENVRRCAICGASNADPKVELRVCDCERCGGRPRELCMEHARNH